MEDFIQNMRVIKQKSTVCGTPLFSETSLFGADGSAFGRDMQTFCYLKNPSS